MPSYTSAFQLKELTDLGMGQTKDMNQGCEPNINGSQAGGAKAWALGTGFGWPDNNEFEYNFPGASCNMNSGAYGAEGGVFTVGGVRPSIKRIAYNGDPTRCCLSGSATDGDKTCDPKYRGGGGECSKVFSDNCQDPKNINSQVCQQTITKNGVAAYAGVINTYCSGVFQTVLATDHGKWELGAGESTAFGSTYTLTMQWDGNLVLIATGNRPVWNSGSGGNGSSIARLQPDGNLVVIAEGNKPTWNSGSGGKGTGPFSVVIRSTGALLVLDGKGAALWASDGNTAIAAITSDFCKTNLTAGTEANVKAYCAANPTDMNFCGCYNFPDTFTKQQALLLKKGLTITPQCNLTQCSANPAAYVPANYKNFSCPTQQICIGGVDLGSVGGSVSLSNVSTTCNLSANTANTANTSNTSNTATTVTAPANTSTAPAHTSADTSVIGLSTWAQIGIVVGVFFLLLILILTRGKK